MSPEQYRFLILDGCEIHIHILSLNIVFLIILLPIVFPLTQLISFNYWMLVYFERLTRFGKVAIDKGNFLPLLVKVRAQAYVKDNILGAWRGSGLISPNPRKVLTKLPSYRDPDKESKPVFPPPVPPTPRNPAAMLCKARQAKLLLQRKNQDIDRVELADLIDSLENEIPSETGNKRKD